MALLTPHWEAPTPKTRAAFHVAAGLPFIQRYYLAGGTGLALHLGHRISVDWEGDSPDAHGQTKRAVVEGRQISVAGLLHTTIWGTVWLQQQLCCRWRLTKR